MLDDRGPGRSVGAGFKGYRHRARLAVTAVSRGHVPRPGLCPVCRARTLFVDTAAHPRNGLYCVRCLSLPRQRAILAVLDLCFPVWPSLIIHESSPGGPASAAIARRGAQYSSSFLLEGVPEGAESNGRTCQNLERLTFPNESFDLFLTQDVMEHVLNPADAFAEIARVIKPGGAHIFTVPYWPTRTTKIRAQQGADGIEYLEEAQYHGNPVDPHGSLVATEWGKELRDVIREASGLHTDIHDGDDPALGLRGTFREVFITIKP
jgi:SAM-dependent methyltransferase